MGRFNWCAAGPLAGRQSHKYSCVINVCGAHAAVCHRRTAVTRVGAREGGGGCFKKRNSFTGSLLELILLHFLRVKPVGPGRKALYPDGEGLRPCDPDVAHEQKSIIVNGQSIGVVIISRQLGVY